MLGLLVFGGLLVLGLVRVATWLVVLASLGGGCFVFFVLRRPLKQQRAMHAELPPAWREVLETNVRFYRRLDPEGRAHFEKNLRLLAATFDFDAVRGVEVTDELRVLSLAGAAVLLQGWDDVMLPSTRSVVLHPASFDENYGGGAHADIAGQVHRQGPILFAVSELRRGWASERDGYNVSIHEFAHVLDLADGYADGKAGAMGWGELLAEELERVRRGRSPLRAYAGTNEAELFAVATEVFFEKPEELRRKARELYDVLAEFYAQDPAADKAPARRSAPRRSAASKRTPLRESDEHGTEHP